MLRKRVIERQQNKSSDNRDLETVSVLAFFCLLFSIVLDIIVLAYAALGFLFIGLFIKRLSRIIAKGWMTFAAALGTVNTRIILFAIFYLVLTPIALLYRLIHGDHLNIYDDPSKKTFWHERNHEFKPEDFEKQW